MPKKKEAKKDETGVPHGGIKRKAAKQEESRPLDMRQSQRAREVRQDPILRGIQDVAISTRIAISNAAKALEYAETTLSQVANDQAKKVGESAKAAKQRAKEIKQAEKKLNRAVEEMRKAKTSLDSTLRGKG